MLEGLLEEDADTTRLCLVARYREELDDDDRGVFDQALSASVSSRALYYRLLRRGAAPYSLSSFERHRGGTCTCR